MIEEVGEKVKRLKVGDRVLSTAPHAEYAVVDEEKAVKVPNGVSDEEATFGTLSATVMNSVRPADIKLGEIVVVVGVGILGQLAYQFSRLCDALPVVAVDLSEKRPELAKKIGVAVTIQPKREDATEKIMKLTRGRKTDVVFEVTGNPKVIPWELSLLKQQGRLILLSSPRGITELDFHDLVNRPSRVIIGTHTSSHPSHETAYNPWTWKRNVDLFFNLLFLKLYDYIKWGSSSQVSVYKLKSFIDFCCMLKVIYKAVFYFKS